MIGEVLLLGNVLVGAFGLVLMWRADRAATFRRRVPVPSYDDAILVTVDSDYKGLV